ncbi:MAG: hypothetical protein H8D47_03635 [Planctomycetes bacterium]|nr:hypothetical protein [Planctomycetota bacterium]MBL7106056.1 hypothetical protein [Phycisphaerae bacterium]
MLLPPPTFAQDKSQSQLPEQLYEYETVSAPLHIPKHSQLPPDELSVANPQALAERLKPSKTPITAKIIKHFLKHIFHLFLAKKIDTKLIKTQKPNSHTQHLLSILNNAQTGTPSHRAFNNNSEAGYEFVDRIF